MRLPTSAANAEPLLDAEVLWPNASEMLAISTRFNLQSVCSAPNSAACVSTRRSTDDYLRGYGRRLRYFVSFYSINGFTPDENHGWTDEFNFGSKSAAAIRWKAAVKAHADLIATDQYEDLAKTIQASR
jgi:hypothetical protein